MNPGDDGPQETIGDVTVSEHSWAELEALADLADRAPRPSSGVQSGESALRLFRRTRGRHRA